MKIAFDVGGVLSKYPRHFTRLMEALRDAGHELHVISDMHPREKILEALRKNGFLLTNLVAEGNVHSADYANYGEACKAALCRDLGIDAIVDDFPGYLVWPWPRPAPLRLLVQPDPYRPYWSALWGTDAEQEFGRRVYSPDRLGSDHPDPTPDFLEERQGQVIDEIRRSRLEDLVEWLSRCVGNPFAAEAEDLRLLLDADRPAPAPGLRIERITPGELDRLAAAPLAKSVERLKAQKEAAEQLEAERDTYKAQLDACLTRIDQLKQEREALREGREKAKHERAAFESKLRACAMRIERLERHRDDLHADLVKYKAGRDQARAALMTAVRQLAWHHDERGNNNWFRSRLLSLLALVLRDDEAERTAIKLDRFERIVQGTEPPVLPADVADDEEDDDPADNEPVIPEGFTDARIAQPDTDRTVQIAYHDGSSASWDLGFYDAPSGEPRKVWWRHRPMQQLADGVVASWKELPKSAKEGPKSGVELHRGCISGPSSGATDAPIVRAEGTKEGDIGAAGAAARPEAPVVVPCRRDPETCSCDQHIGKPGNIWEGK